MQKEQLIHLISQNLTTREIAKVMKKSQSATNYWLAKYGLKTIKSLRKSATDSHKTCSICSQVFELSYFYKRSLLKYTSACKSCLNAKSKIRHALKEKKPRKKYVVTPETKAKISKARKEFLKNNPDKHNWKYHNKFKSVPCEHLKDYLRLNNISFLEEYSVSQERFYSVDIAFPHKMIAIEVNGRQHYNDSNQLKPYYQERHDYIKGLGWTIIELYYAKVFQKKFKENLLNLLLVEGITQEQIDLFEYITPRVKKVKKKIPRKSKITCTIEEILSLVKQLGIKKASIIVGCSDNGLRKHLRKHQIDPKQYSYYNYRKMVELQGFQP